MDPCIILRTRSSSSFTTDPTTGTTQKTTRRTTTTTGISSQTHQKSTRLRHRWIQMACLLCQSLRTHASTATSSLRCRQRCTSTTRAAAHWSTNSKFTNTVTAARIHLHSRSHHSRRHLSPQIIYGRALSSTAPPVPSRITFGRCISFNVTFPPYRACHSTPPSPQALTSDGFAAPPQPLPPCLFSTPSLSPRLRGHRSLRQIPLQLPLLSCPKPPLGQTNRYVDSSSVATDPHYLLLTTHAAWDCPRYLQD
jgi:hypothetical protein